MVCQGVENNKGGRQEAKQKYDRMHRLAQNEETTRMEAEELLDQMMDATTECAAMASFATNNTSAV